MWIDYTAYIGGIFLMISFLPQIMQSIRLKETRDIAWGMLLCSLFSGIFYEIYAIGLGLKPVVIMNGVFVVMVIVQICLKYIYDKNV
ncbi:MAG TPA: hypothetical protein ENI74_01100 [Gammaproteobacteria bacterium]|nr:hypothetical protein [Gammaproteobacteria bacterium]